MNPPAIDLFQHKYRIASARRFGYDYSQAGAYFITICTANRGVFFGEVVADENTAHQVTLRGTPLALTAVTCWRKIPEFHPFAVPADFVVMPDHVHGILFIERPPDYVGGGPNQFGPQRDNLAAVVRGFKMGVTKAAREIAAIDAATSVGASASPAGRFGWQSRFHDRIIRTDEELARLQWYIEQNPTRWHEERGQPDGIFR